MLPATDINRRSFAAGWVMSELLFTVAAAIALGVLSWRMYLNHAQMAENSQKASTAILEISAFLHRAETDVRDAQPPLIPPPPRTAYVIRDEAGFELPGGQQVIRGGACWLDAGDTTLGFQEETAAYQGIVRTCVPCADSVALITNPGLAALGSVTCTLRGAGLPKRCPTQLNLRSGLFTLAGSQRAAAPASTPLRQGIWIPADSLQDAAEIKHLLRSNPQFGELPPVKISRVTEGVFVCL